MGRAFASRSPYMRFAVRVSSKAWTGYNDQNDDIGAL
jgi:hypothetical protein